jgi:hypothetical protein
VKEKQVMKIASTIQQVRERRNEARNGAANGKVQDDRRKATKGMEQSLRELSHIVNGLKKLGVNSREISKVVKPTNREVNKTIGREIKQAYNDFRSHKTDKQSFHAKLYGSAVKKLDGIVSALGKVYDQKIASAEAKTVSIKPIETSAQTVAQTEALLSKMVTEVTKDIGIISLDSNGSPDKMFAEIVDFFNGIDKLVNRFADKVEGKDSNDKDNGQGIVKFASNLNKMFSHINKAFGRHSNDNVGHRLGMAQIKKETISQLFDSGHGSGAINRIGDAGDGSGNFNAVSFMSSLSNSINDGLESYKDMQKAEKESNEESKEESKEAVGTLA